MESVVKLVNDMSKPMVRHKQHYTCLVHLKTTNIFPSTLRYQTTPLLLWPNSLGIFLSSFHKIVFNCNSKCIVHLTSRSKNSNQLNLTHFFPHLFILKCVVCGNFVSCCAVLLYQDIFVKEILISKGFPGKIKFK